MKSLLTMDMLKCEEMLSILKDAENFKTNSEPIYFGKQLFAANMFFENSTRTRNSFEIAEKKLGLEVVNFDAERSSINKGESLYDTMKTMEALGTDLFIIRHKEDGYYNELINSVKVPIINAGDGCGEHPTQCLLDLMTIKEEFGGFQGLNVLISGDVSHSRVAHSDYNALTRLGAKVYFSGPEMFRDKKYEDLNVDMDEVIGDMDVVMMLRVQKERIEDPKQGNVENYLETYGLNLTREARMKKTAIIMHPAPVNRGVELDTSLVESEKSRIFKQMENGVFTRMAVIKRALG